MSGRGKKGIASVGSPLKAKWHLVGRHKVKGMPHGDLPGGVCVGEKQQSAPLGFYLLESHFKPLSAATKHSTPGCPCSLHQRERWLKAETRVQMVTGQPWAG